METNFVEWDELEGEAYALLNLKPDEFFELTPREYYLMLEGYKFRRRQQAMDLLWQLAPHYKNKLPPLHEITGFIDEKQEVSIEERKEDFKNLVNKLAKGR
jgi:hypothetical protein